ncbi:histidine kinase [Gordonia sp. HY285]|uniref:sensor histidine kinase n=1 Tax=Gordonia liuliyuniae TaxID=2911517 RepID=UPI001F0303C3|nr:histidine kinase [Gordonia liuliyuniae]MCF8609111.1 histidine kinase [Gordonia liuliyuniae]
MNLTPDRWRRLSDPTKYRLYTRLTLEVTVIGLAVFAVAAARGHLAVAAILVVSCGAAVAQFEARPELTGRAPSRSDTWLTVGAAVCLVGAWLCGVALRAGWDDETARGVGWFVLALASVSTIAFATMRWPILLVSTLATAAAYGSSADFVQHCVALLAMGAFLVGITRLTMWTLRVVDDLDDARRTEAQLHVAEERLRFARDLHDVVGRGFSTVAVKSELASRLSRAGAAEQAAAEMDEVKALAVASMEEMRALVRGYRDIDLPGEVAGARALLDAAGCRLVVEGDIAAVPPTLHETAAWVVREGTTNIVRHSSATAATLSLGQSGMTLSNDGAPADEGEHSGLRGLAERLSDVGGVLATRSEHGTFTLEIRWETA